MRRAFVFIISRSGSPRVSTVNLPVANSFSHRRELYIDASLMNYFDPRAECSCRPRGHSSRFHEPFKPGFDRNRLIPGGGEVADFLSDTNVRSAGGCCCLFVFVCSFHPRTRFAACDHPSSRRGSRNEIPRVSPSRRRSFDLALPICK